jgi:tRNA (guanine10-N2)-dimethyltransferase
VAKLFFLLSGEHEDLPASELRAVLEAEGHRYQVLEKLDQVLRIEADPECINAIRRRTAFTRLCGLELLTCEAEIGAIVKATRSICAETILEESETFSVRVRHVRQHSAEVDGMRLERKIGELILSQKPAAEVDLRKPDKAFFGVLTNGKFIFGLRLAEIAAKPFVERRPRKKPFFHPSAMPAKLARCMVNLARVKAEELVLDPFCGTGTTLIEARLVGCRVFGMDIQRRMVRGTLRNLAYFGIEPEGVVIADAESLPVARVDCVVTDPPYGISSTTAKRTTERIVEQILGAAYELLKKGQKVCIAAPKKLNITRLAGALSYKHLESHFVYVHRSLTREIVVLEKV